VDAVARGEVGNREASRDSGFRFVVAALDTAVEYGGFAFDKDDRDLIDCMDSRINYLTDNRRIGIADWLENPQAFLTRARYWNTTEAFAQIYAYAVLAELMREQFDGSWRDEVEAGDGLSSEVRGDLWMQVRHGGRRSENARAHSRPFDGGDWREHRSELQFGVHRPVGRLGSDVRAGISGHVTRVDANVRNGRSPEESGVAATGYGGAAGLTWFGRLGPYVAANVRFSRWAASVGYRARAVSTEIDGHSWWVSTESGWRLVGNGIRMTPRLRVAWTGVDLDRFADSDGVVVQQVHDRSIEAALGLATGIVTPVSKVRLHTDIELVHDFEEDSAITAYGYRFRSGLADSWVRWQLGLVREFSPRLDVGLDLHFGTALGPDTGNTSTWGVQAGVRWAL
jgi:outer membrane autotransporter protein